MNRNLMGVPLMVMAPVLAAVFVVIALFGGMLVADITAETMMREVVQCSAAVNTAIGNSFPTFFYIGIIALMVTGGFFLWRNGMGGGTRLAAMVGLAFLVGLGGNAVTPADIAYAETPCVLVDGTRAITGNTTLNDDVLLRLGTGGDIVQLNRSTILAADAELTNVIVGTSNTPGVAANSLILSNITQDGDIMVAVNNGGNSIGVALVDASAGQTEFNPAAADWNFVVQSGSNAQMLAVDGATNSVRIGGNNIADTGSLLVYAKPSIATTGSPSHSWWTSSTTTIPEAGAFAEAYGAYFGQTTWAGTAGGVGETITDAATVYILGAPIQGADMTLSNPYSLWVDAGETRLDGTLTASGGGALTGTWSDLGIVTTVDVNGGTLDGVTIGGAVAGAGTFTTVDASGLVSLGTPGSAVGAVAGDILLPNNRNIRMSNAGGTAAAAVMSLTGADAVSIGSGSTTAVLINNGLQVLSNAILGSGEAGTTAATGNTFRAPDITTGGAGNIAGADITFAAGLGTGTGDEGTIIFQLPIQVGAGDFIQTRATRMTLDMAGSATVLSMAGAHATTLTTAAGDLTLSPAADVDVTTNLGINHTAFANVTGNAIVATGGIAFTDVLNAWIDDATHGTGTTPIYIGNSIIVVNGATTASLGITGTSTGILELDGATSGTVSLTAAAAAGTWTMTLPTAAGGAGEQLTDAAGNGVTSWAAAASRREWKENIVAITDPSVALALVRGAKVYEFNYREGFGTQDTETRYVGVMADEAPWAMHYKGNIVNPVNTLGYAVLAIQGTNDRIDTLQDSVDALKAEIQALRANQQN